MYMYSVYVLVHFYLCSARCHFLHKSTKVACVTHWGHIFQVPVRHVLWDLVAYLER